MSCGDSCCYHEGFTKYSGDCPAVARTMVKAQNFCKEASTHKRSGWGKMKVKGIEKVTKCATKTHVRGPKVNVNVTTTSPSPSPPSESCNSNDSVMTILTLQLNYGNNSVTKLTKLVKHKWVCLQTSIIGLIRYTLHQESLRQLVLCHIHLGQKSKKCLSCGIQKHHAWLATILSRYSCSYLRAFLAFACTSAFCFSFRLGTALFPGSTQIVRPHHGR